VHTHHSANGNMHAHTGAHTHTHICTLPDREHWCTGSVMSVDPNINKEPPESHTDTHAHTPTYTHAQTPLGHLAQPVLQIANSLIQETTNYD